MLTKGHHCWHQAKGAFASRFFSVGLSMSTPVAWLHRPEARGAGRSLHAARPLFQAALSHTPDADQIRSTTVASSSLAEW
jgi:hypothetical protein